MRTVIWWGRRLRAEPADADTGVGEVDRQGRLLSQVRDSAVRLVADVPQAPRTVRVRAADVSVELEWPERHAWPEPDRPAPPGGPGAPATVEPPAGGNGHLNLLVAPTVGVFYRAPAPGEPPFVQTGDTVVRGQQVAIIEAMKLMIPVESDRGGRIVEVLKENEQSVEYGEPLFALAPVDQEAG